MKYSFLNLAKDVYFSVKTPLAISEVWNKAVEFGLTEKLGTSGKTPWNTLGARIYMDIKNNPDTDFVQVSKRPAKFYI